MHAGQPHLRDRLAALLWGDTGDEQARNSLRQALFTLRRRLAARGSACLIVESDSVAVDPVAVHVDVLRFQELSGQDTREALEGAIKLYRGELLEGLSLKEAPFEDWLLAERERLRERAIETLARLLRVLVQAGAVEEAIHAAMQLLALDPLQEVVHRTLMSLHARLGRWGAARRQYQTCVGLLERELGIRPEPATVNLYEELLGTRRASQGPALAADPAESAREAAGSRRSILVVEDDPVTRTLLEGFLADGGYAVMLAETGADALFLLGHHRFDLVVSDVRMPTLDGLALLEVMHRKGLRTPTIFITAHDDDELEARGFELGAADYIHKPIRKDALLLHVKTALRKAGREPAEQSV